MGGHRPRRSLDGACTTGAVPSSSHEVNQPLNCRLPQSSQTPKGSDDEHAVRETRGRGRRCWRASSRTAGCPARSRPATCTATSGRASRSPGSCRGRSHASRISAGCGRTRCAPPTAGGPACGSTSTRGWLRARRGRSEEVGARRGAGNRQDPPRGFVSFVGWSPPSFFSRFFSRDQTLGIPNSLAASERLQRRPLEDRLTSGPPASRDATRSPLLPLPPAEFPMRSRESWAKAQQPASNSGQAP